MSNSKRRTDDGEAADEMVPVDGFFTDGGAVRGRSTDAANEGARGGAQTGLQDSAIDLAQAFWGAPEAFPVDSRSAAPPAPPVWSMTPDSQSGGRSGAAGHIWGGGTRTESPLAPSDASPFQQPFDPFGAPGGAPAPNTNEALRADAESAGNTPQEISRSEAGPPFDPFMGSPFGAPLGAPGGSDFFPGAPTVDLPEPGSIPPQPGAGESYEGASGGFHGEPQPASPLWTSAPFDDARGEAFHHESHASELNVSELSDGEPSLHPASLDESGAEILPWPGRAASGEAPTPSISSNLPDEFLSDASQRLPASNFDPDGGPDLLAEAVQSALRSVYGDDLGDDLTPEQGSYMAERGLLREPSAGAPDVPPGMTSFRDIYGVDPDGSGRTAQGPSEEGAEDWFGGRLDHQPGAFVAEPTTEAATEAVLHYLYGRREGGDPTDGFGGEPQYVPEAGPYGDRPQIGGGRGPGSPYTARRADDPTSFDEPYARHPSGGRTEPSFRSHTAGDDLRWDSDYQREAPTTGRSLTRVQQAESETRPHGPDGVGHEFNDKDSGRLLGVAGLSLIGGIAVGGVVAAIAFNFFVSDPGVENMGEQHGLAAPARAGQEIALNSPLGSTTVDPSTVAATPAAMSPGEGMPRGSRAVKPAGRAAAPGNADETAIAAPAQQFRQLARVVGPISVSDATGAAPGPIPISLAIASSAPAEAALVSIKGLPDQAKLSGGIDVGGGRWLLPPQKVDGLALSVPAGVYGDFKLEAQLMASDVRTAVSDPTPFTVTIIGSGPADSPAGAAPLSPAVPQLPRSDEERPGRRSETQENRDLLQDGNKLMREGDILGARKYYERVASAGSPEGALAMGRSYDPSYYENLPVRTGKPDPAQAFEWYKKALDGGLDTARVKIDNLKQWLLR